MADPNDSCYKKPNLTVDTEGNPVFDIDGNPDCAAAMLEALGVESCKNITAAGVSLFPLGGVGMTSAIGCEKIAVSSSIISQTSDILNCKMTDVTQSKSLSATSKTKIKINVADSSFGQDLNITTETTVEIINETAFTQSKRTEMAVLLDTMIESIKTVTQDEVKKGLGSSDGQKVVSEFNANIDNSVSQIDTDKIVQTSLTKFMSDTEVSINIVRSTVGRDGNINTTNVIKACVSDMISSTITSIFDATVKTKVRETLDITQSSKVEGLSLGFGVGGIIILLLMLFFLGYLVKMMVPLMGIYAMFQTKATVCLVLGLVCVLTVLIGGLTGWLDTTILGILSIVGFVLLCIAAYLFLVRKRQYEKTKKIGSTIINNIAGSLGSSGSSKPMKKISTTINNIAGSLGSSGSSKPVKKISTTINNIAGSLGSGGSSKPDE